MEKWESVAVMGLVTMICILLGDLILRMYDYEIKGYAVCGIATIAAGAVAYVLPGHPKRKEQKDGRGTRAT